MDIYTDQINDQNAPPPSHYEFVVFEEEMTPAIQQTKQISFIYMDQLEGWCTKNKAAVLIDLVYMIRPKTIVEIGVWGGKSLVPMAYACQALGSGKVYGIDPWDAFESIQGMDGVNYDWWSRIDHSNILTGLLNKISQFKLSDQIQLVRSTSLSAAPIPNIDILHVDGNHSENAAMIDVNKWVPLVRTGGIIIFDDVTWTNNEKAVQWLDDNCTRVVVFSETNDWGIWLKH